MDIFALGAVGLIAFGTTWAVDKFFKRFTSVRLQTTDKFVVSFIVALAAGFIPVELGNEILNRVKEAFGIATALAGGFQLLGKVADRVSIPPRA